MVKSLGDATMDVKKALKKYSEQTDLAYEEVPPELLDADALDLSKWSLIVNDNVLHAIAKFNRERIKEYIEVVRQADEERKARAEAGKKKHKPRSPKPVKKKVEDDAGASATVNIPPPPVGLRGIQQLAGVPEVDEDEEPLPGWAAEAVGLVALNVAGSEAITDYGLHKIAQQCGTLSKLNLRGAYRLGDVGMRALAMSCTTNLKEVDISGCMGLSGPGLASLGQSCPNITTLRMAGCRQIAQYALLKVFNGCRDLEHVDFSHCTNIRDDELRVMGEKCAHIQHVDLKGCPQTSDTGVLAVATGCSGLQYLDLSRSEFPFKVTDISLMALGERTPYLETLLLSGCNMLTDAGLNWLAKGCHALQTVRLAGCEKITNAGVRTMAEANPLLKELDLSNLKRVTDVGVRYISERCKALEKINLKNLFLLSDGMKRDFGLEGLQALCGDLDEVQHLHLHGCFQISTTAMRAIANGLGAPLRSLSLSNCPKLTLNGMQALWEHCASLEYLSLNGCGENIVDNFFRPLVRRPAACLRTLELEDAECLTHTGVAYLVAGCPQLDKLNLSGCVGLNDEAMLHLGESQFYPGLRHLHLTNCTNISDAGLSWMSDGVDSLYTLSLRGTRCTYTALRVIADRYRYSHMVRNANFFGLYPLRRALDRKMINEYGAMIKATIKIQSLYRARKAREKAEMRRRKHYMEWTARKLQALWRARQAKKYVELVREYKRFQGRMATLLQNWWRCQLAQKLLKIMLEADYIRRCGVAAVEVQRVWRGVLGRKKATMRRKETMRRLRLQKRASVHIQRVARGYMGRRVARARRKELEELLALQ
eukprot:CAMPEP_0118879012 /NCGR_PEP_ID=MMETSP1163-20130328/18872_1 /TAXON_ID=124430 /ORGANISM="Phaeomonas parva, Strain CCMP2877" /LENGTH=822 /DNA_ID=CAMNT_0006815021 /DNA_START=227 /DNA_END=2692 /DNA_ORIENTATION=+